MNMHLLSNSTYEEIKFHLSAKSGGGKPFAIETYFGKNLYKFALMSFMRRNICTSLRRKAINSYFRSKVETSKNPGDFDGLSFIKKSLNKQTTLCCKKMATWLKTKEL